MTAPSEGPVGADREPPRTASGLDESQIAAEDLRELHQAVKLNSLLPPAQVQLQTLAGWEIALPAAALKPTPLDFNHPPLFNLRIVPLPTKARLHKLALQAPALRVKRDLAPVLRCSIRRRKLRVDDLPPDKQKALFTALYDKYGEAARELDAVAVFAHVPPEAAELISVDPELAWAAFRLPPGKAPAAAKAGFYLVVLRTPAGETRKVLFRL